MAGLSELAYGTADPLAVLTSPSSGPLMRAHALQQAAGGGGPASSPQSGFTTGSIPGVGSGTSRVPDAGAGGGGSQSAGFMPSVPLKVDASESLDDGAASAADHIGRGLGGGAGLDFANLGGSSPMAGLQAAMTPNAYDKNMALAQAGFAMAGSNSPYFGQAFGQGMGAGLQALQQRMAQRAEAAMRLAELQKQSEQLKQTTAYQNAELAQRAAYQTSIVALTKQERDTQAAAAAAQQQLHRDTLDATNEQRYQANAAARDRAFYATGAWRDIPGDEDHGVSGKPAPAERPALPQVSDPATPQKVVQSLDQAHPQAYGALQSFTDDTNSILKKVAALETHPGLSAGTGLFGAVVGQIPGTDAKDFNSMKDSLVADLQLGALGQMRLMAKNGSSGLGRVTNTEMGILGNKVAALNSAQSVPALKAALADVADYMQNSATHIRDAYVETYGQTYKGKSPPVLPWEKTAAASDAEPKINTAPPAATTAAAPTAEDIAHTAKIHGISEDEVRKRLGIANAP